MAIESITPANHAEFVEKIQAQRDVATGKVPPVVATEADIEKAADELTETSTPASVEEDEPDTEYSEKVRKRIAKEVKRRKEEEEFAQSQYSRAVAAERENLKMAERLAALEKQVAPTEVAPEDVRPSPSAYTDQAKYEDDLLAWNRRQSIKEYESQQAAKAAQAEADRNQAELRERIKEFAKTTPDYDDVIARSTVAFQPALQMALVESPVVAQLGYHLARNPAEAERINKLSPTRAVAELGKIEARLTKPEGTPFQEAKTVGSEARTRAPAPITPLQASSSAQPTGDPSKMSLQQLKQYYREQRRK